MPLPIAHGLVGASTVAAARPRNTIKRDWLMLVAGAVLAIIPDFDFFPSVVLHASRSWHRGFTHSILMAVIVFGFLLLVLGTSRLKESVAFVVAYLSHGLLDWATTKRGGGVELLWPFSTERFKLGLIGFSEFTHGFALPEMIKDGLIEFAVFTPLLLIILLLRERLFSNKSPTA